MNLGIGTAMASAQMYSTSRPVQPTTQDAPIPLPADPIDPLAGPSGATAQTGGFVQGGTSPTSSHPPGFGGGFGGGLASSPNVPRPGSSIDPATGKPHTAGLTRAELEAKKAAEASSSSTLTIDGKRLNDLSGREQAARQLTGTADDVITPGHELPGGWGPAKQVGVPGSGPNATSSVYEDIAEGLEKVGTAAYNLIPKGLKDALNPDLPLDKGKQPEGSPPPRRRSSVVAFLDNVKQGTGAFLHDVTDTFQSDRRVSLSSIGSNRGAGASSVSGTTSHTNEPSVLAQVKTFFAETVDAIEGNTNAKVAGTVTGSVAPRTSLPSNETAGALPGEHSTGVGALPGNATESGVAVLPEEKKLDPDLPLGNQGLRPGETPAGLSASSSVVPAIPEEDTPAATPAVEAAEADLGLQDKAVPTGTSVGLAPPLPATFLGQGAAEGATDLEQAGLPSAEEITDPKDVTSTAAAAIHETSNAADNRHANDRTTSTASITAIRHGHEGQRPSPLAESTVPETEALTSTNATSNATSLTPGAEADGVGHPSSRTEKTTREPESYPDADHSTVTGSSVAPTTTTSVPANGDALKPDLTHSEHETSRDSSIPVTPKSPSTKLQSHSPPHTATDKAIGHQRSGSNVSTGSNGKKKVGFMKKLKGEMKVIGGKLANDEKKVEEGQKIKHGEL